ncbi:25S rRNA (adenine(645)-N(1))-methyltransferase [Sparassis crispa]|uniref:Ribosomal RNA-processing protein 8 n=1 Tax=Sparassis crispa TaxID=139825 RepID=A0A401GB20_9APHY|nr:25S rRNA (adenine(645)-N(1))-methyltransferase [Sparassis crispa]GBE79347.1 25S rRNA (adenine(645)-N(1))-methyltransferase [Sparassis crispa]
MALFEVPGWSVPSTLVSDGPHSARKRKRVPAQDGDRVSGAVVNFEKLMKKLAAGSGTGKEAERPRGNAKRKNKIPKRDTGRGDKEKEKKARRETGRPQDACTQVQRGESMGMDKGRANRKKKGEAVRAEPSDGRDGVPPTKEEKKKLAQSVPLDVHDEEGPSRKKRKWKDKQKNQDDAASHDAPRSSSTGRPTQTSKAEQGLTALQAGMKSSLDGARFRWINELLYKSDSEHAHQMMRENPKAYEEYHTGFRHQVHAWPTNPVAHYIAVLGSYSLKTVIADLGCGDAALARALTPKGLTVLSFDLVSDGTFVVEADTCARVPLPGSDTEGEGEGSVVDVVVCALSLMGTNWLGCVREAWRILKAGGELKIAEVASRFTDVDEFTSVVSSIGFRLKSKDDSNTHFTLFEFKKVARKAKGEKEWEKLLARGSVLKPCEYKRR